MMKNACNRIWSLLLVFALVLNIIPATFLMVSAENLDSPSGISASYDAGDGITWKSTVTENVGTIDGSAVGGEKCNGFQNVGVSRTTNLKIENSSGSNKLLIFKYSVTVQSGSVTVAGTTYSSSASNLTYKSEITAGSSITIQLVTAAAKDDTSSISITELQLSDPTQAVNVTFDVASGGTYTVDNTKIEAKTTKSGSATTSYSVSASPASGKVFCGWMNTVDNTLVSSKITDSIIPENGMIIKPVFSDSATAWYLAGGTHLYTDLNAAVDFAASDSAKEKTVILLNSATLASGTYTVDSGVTLVIPYNDLNAVVKTAPVVSTSYTTPSVYRTLTMANGANLVLDGGHLSVGGSLAASQTYGYNGLPSGPLGFIKMETGSTIQANTGSSMYVIGYIYGDGSVTVNTGATVYECFQIRDFRGGTATGSLTSGWGTKIFPLSQYYVQNIEVPMTLNAGSIVKCLSAFNINGGIQIPEVPFIGNSTDYMFQITNGNVVKDYIEETDRLNVKINGSLSLSSFVFSIPGFSGMADIDTSEYTLPINHNLTIELMEGKSLTLNQDIALLPGAEILVHDNATCTLGSGTDIIVYDSSEWGPYCGEKHSSNNDDVPVKPLDYVAGGAPKVNRLTAYNTSPTNASIMINGTVDATSGNIYVTASGANIYSTGEGELKLPKSPSNGSTKQVIQDGSSVSDQKTITTYPAKLTHQNSSILNTAGNTSAVTYNYAHYNPNATTDAEKTGIWLAGTHSFGEWGASSATCTTAGTKSRTCACGYTETVAVPATGHTFGTTVAANAATCLAAGNNAYKQCTACKLYFADNAATNATDGKADISTFALSQKAHSYTGAIKSDGNGQTATHSFLCINGCGQYGGAVTHTWNGGVETQAPTCTDEGIKTYTCTVGGCGGTYTESVDALTHSWGEADYTWSDDNLSCTAKRVCGRDATHIESETVDTTSEVKTPATCINKGTTTYTATFTATWAGTKTKDVEDIPETGIHTDADGKEDAGFLLCDGCQAPVARLASLEASADAATELRMKFYIHPSLTTAEDGSKLAMKAQVKFAGVDPTDELVNLSEMETDKSGRYVFICNVNSGEMRRYMTVSFTDANDNSVIIIDGQTSADAVSRSVADYAELVLANGSDKQKNVIKALLTYGGYAQIYFNVDADNPVYNLLGETPNLDAVAIPTLESLDTKFGDIQFTQAEVFLQSAIKMQYTYTAATPDDDSFLLTYAYKNQPYTKAITPTSNTVNENTVYYLVVEEIPAAYFGHKYAIDITEGENTGTIAMSVYDYLYLLLNPKNPEKPAPSLEMINLAKAMYLYGEAANAFFFPVESAQ